MQKPNRETQVLLEIAAYVKVNLVELPKSYSRYKSPWLQKVKLKKAHLETPEYFCVW